MALGFQARAMLRGLAKLGEPSTLAGLACGKVAIERDVILFAGIGNTAEDNHVVKYTVLSIASQPSGVDFLLGLPPATTSALYAPKVGQTVVHPDGSFVLDRQVDDNGFVRRFIAVPV